MVLATSASAQRVLGFDTSNEYDSSSPSAAGVNVDGSEGDKGLGTLIPTDLPCDNDAQSWKENRLPRRYSKHFVA